MKKQIYCLFILLLFQSNIILAVESIPKRQLKFDFIYKAETQKIDLEKISIQKIKTTKIKTSSQYDKGINEFEGVLLEDFLKYHIGNSRFKEIKIKATDDYTQFILREEIEKYHPLIAFKMNGKYLLPNNRGTFRIIFDNSKLSHEIKLKLDPKWIWNIKSVEVIIE